MNRRHFLRAGAAGVISLNHFPHHLFAAAMPRNATDRILLGPRKIELSRMAMGTGTSGSNGSSNQTRKLGYHGVAELFRAAYDQGINFWDSADQYGSHTYIRDHRGRRQGRYRSLPPRARRGYNRYPAAPQSTGR